jgi:hypothetical protein
MGERARIDAARFTTQRTMESVYQVVKVAAASARLRPAALAAH